MVGDLRCCEWCYTAFIAVQYAQKHCSYKCGYMAQNSKKPLKPRRVQECQRCGADLSHKKSHAIYCSKTCKSMDHTFRHRAKTRIGGHTRRRAIIQRDNATCYLCGKNVPANEIELDHLIPVAQGGTSEPENVAVACRWCNRSRGASMDIRQVLKRNQIRSLAWQ